MSTIAASIRATFDTLDLAPRLMRGTFGTEGADEVAAMLEAFSADHLGGTLAGVEFVSASVGLVLGLRLQDDTRVVVKVHRSETSRQFLTATQIVQRHAAARGFPCPQPMLGPLPLGTGIAVAESLLAAEDRANAHRVGVRRTMAEALAWLVSLCRDIEPPAGLLERPMSAAPGALWPPPHDRRFDFDGTTRGAEWIDAIAVRAAEQRDSMPEAEPVIGHSDWSAQNVRFRGADVAAVYDWDSVAFEQEAILLGWAAHAFSADWSVPRKRQLPTVRESLAFIADYEAARGASLNEAERRVTLGALVYARAYAARCAHSDVLTDFGRTVPTGSLADDTPGNRARSSLRSYERLLLA